MDIERHGVDATRAAQHFFAGAVAAGLTRVVLSPGSRSTPLALAAATTPGIKHVIHLDERTAAFAALGESKVGLAPVALVCTSGTAAANYLPAVAEASMSGIALVVITADRPPEHQDWGVGQSFDQRGLYARQVRDEITMPVGGSANESFYERAAWRAVRTAVDQRGPVHVNWAFRLPLEPDSLGPGPTSQLEASRAGGPNLDSSEVDALSELLDGRTAVLSAGPHSVPTRATEKAASLLTAAAKLGIPVLADVLSGLRGHGELIAAPAHVVPTPNLDPPDVLLRLGHTPTAKAQRLWWESTNAHQVLLDPRSEWQDPSHMARDRFRSDPVALLQEVGLRKPRIVEGHRAHWIERGMNARSAVESVLGSSATFTEAHVAATLMATEPEIVVASSSMPVRDLDLFGTVDQPTTVVSNRGINGIDGVVATAVGVGRSTGNHVTVLIGDVAALHDVGSIYAAARHQIPMSIVIPNNNGGGIFSNLPIRSSIEPGMFTELFHTPHHTTFEFLAAHRGINHRIATSSDELEAALLEAATTETVSVIEAPVQTSERLQLAADLASQLQS